MSETPTRDPAHVDILALLTTQGGPGAIWSHAAEDLNVNLVTWPAGSGVPEHVNAEVDVVLMCVEGVGRVLIDGRSYELNHGCVLVIPKGAPRSIQSLSARFAYLSVHRGRTGLWPAPLGTRGRP